MRFLNQNLSLYAQIAILWFTEKEAMDVDELKSIVQNKRNN